MRVFTIRKDVVEFVDASCYFLHKSEQTCERRHLNKLHWAFLQLDIQYQEWN